jgi:hypothetical protein
MTTDIEHLVMRLREEAQDDPDSLLYKAADAIDERNDVLRKLMTLPEAERQLHYLARGIGTKTHHAVWADAMRLSGA